MGKEMKPIMIRKMPESLWWKAKALAASQQITIRDLIVKLLTEATKEK
uniref:Uncharacterized protein n=1 Tax=viral metagenome TaxID=1070528 RepID=A0A6M3LVF9_9ZZZZ